MICITVLREAGHDEALQGLSLSYYDGATPIDRWYSVDKINKAKHLARKLAHRQGGHNKFLESIQVWLLVEASRAFWQEFDTYRVGITKQSASTMHTLSKRPVVDSDFTPNTLPETIDNFEKLRLSGADVNTLKDNLPEGYKQTRIICTSYKVLQHIISQRQGHRYKSWGVFIEHLLNQVEHPYYLVKTTEEK